MRSSSGSDSSKSRMRNEMAKKAAPDIEQREKLYEGKAKIVFATNRPGYIVQYFKDDATAFNALKRGTIVDRKSTRLNSSHLVISYAVFCLKKKNTIA